MSMGNRIIDMYIESLTEPTTAETPMPKIVDPQYIAVSSKEVFKSVIGKFLARGLDKITGVSGDEKSLIFNSRLENTMTMLKKFWENSSDVYIKIEPDGRFSYAGQYLPVVGREVLDENPVVVDLRSPPPKVPTAPPR